MAIKQDKLDAVLNDWPSLDEKYHWESLVVGNGASRAVWDNFRYQTLFAVAQSLDGGSKLTAEDTELFAALGGTVNFEEVLGALLVTRKVGNCLGLQPAAVIDQRYTSIQGALVGAVHSVHIPWAKMNYTRLKAIRSALEKHTFISSTNYDLLLYWAVMTEQVPGIKDFFWDGYFDPSNVSVFGDATRVLFLHGGLHLTFDSSGRTYKEVASPYNNLLEQFGTYSGRAPLCITEGSSAQKLNAILRSSYLSFAYQQLAARRGSLAIFGHSMGDSDLHLVQAINRKANRRLAVGLYPISDVQIIQEKSGFLQKFPDAEVLFFDARSHPLGASSLKVVG